MLSKTEQWIFSEINFISSNHTINVFTVKKIEMCSLVTLNNIFSRPEYYKCAKLCNLIPELLNVFEDPAQHAHIINIPAMGALR